jgi:hypothetical protein
MDRFGYIPFDQDKEDQRTEEKAERRLLRSAPVDDNEDEPDPDRFGSFNPQDDEFESVETFAEWLMDNDRSEFNHCELMCLNFRTHLATVTLRQELAGYGFKLTFRPKERSFRGFKANSHDLYAGNPMCGGGGGASIYGMVD